MARATVLIAANPERWHSKARLHIKGKLIVSSGDYASEVAANDLILVSNEYREVASITSDLVLVASDAFSDNANDLAPKRLVTLTAISGSINVTASAAVVGVGTRFLSEVAIGDLLVIGTATVGEARPVVAITDDLNLTVGSAFTDLADDAAPQVCKITGADGLPDFETLSGSIDPAASTTVTGVNTRFLGDGIPFDLRNAEISSNQVPSQFRIWGKNGFLYHFQPKETRQTLTGSIDTAASTTVTGVGTLFLDELVVGDKILVGIEERFVTAIASQLSLTVNRAFTDQADDTSPQVVRTRDASLKNGRFQIRGLVASGGAAAALTGALHLVGQVLSKEEAADEAGFLTQLPTAAVPAQVLDDDIEFEAILKTY